MSSPRLRVLPHDGCHGLLSQLEVPEEANPLLHCILGEGKDRGVPCGTGRPTIARSIAATT